MLHNLPASKLQQLQHALRAYVRTFHSDFYGTLRSSGVPPTLLRSGVYISRISLKGTTAHARFLRQLLALSHTKDCPQWAPHLKRRLIRLTHQLQGYNGIPGIVQRATAQVEPHLTPAAIQSLTEVLSKPVTTLQDKINEILAAMPLLDGQERVPLSAFPFGPPKRAAKKTRKPASASPVATPSRTA